MDPLFFEMIVFLFRFVHAWGGGCIQSPIPTILFLNFVGRLLTFIPNSNNVESLLFKSGRRCPVDVGIEFNLFLFEFNCTIVEYKPTATKELSPSIGLDMEAKSCIRYQAGNNEMRVYSSGSKRKRLAR
jgi:hypothetical protein